MLGYNMHHLVPFEGTPVRIGDEKDSAGGGLGEPRRAPTDQGGHLCPGLDEEEINWACERGSIDQGSGVRKGGGKACQKTVLMDRGVGSRQEVDTDPGNATLNPRE
jgi:hypothetical protein